MSNISSHAREIFAFVLGVILAAIFAKPIAGVIPVGAEKVLFFDAFTANQIAVWFVICSTVTMLVGKIQSKKAMYACKAVNVIGLGILYISFCRIVEQMNHYIIFSIIICGVLLIIWKFLASKKDDWLFASFYSGICLCLVIFQVLFFNYVYMVQKFGFSAGAFLLVAKIVGTLFAFILLVQTVSDK